MKLRIILLLTIVIFGLNTIDAQTLRGSNGMSIGKIESDGTVRGSNGMSIGKAENCNPKHAAACFFFFFHNQ
ncbi:MAG: hypothetical protein J5610_05715 [Prevotella sp.]|nr:hypothetical protein [Prevotella sp.]